MIFNRSDELNVSLTVSGKSVKRLILHENRDEMHRQNPACVRQVLRFSSGYTYPIFPSCKCTLEREYQSYCDRCGQCLNWNRFDKVTIVQWTKEYGYKKIHQRPEKRNLDDIRLKGRPFILSSRMKS